MNAYRPSETRHSQILNRPTPTVHTNASTPRSRRSLHSRPILDGPNRHRPNRHLSSRRQTIPGRSDSRKRQGRSQSRN